MPRRDGFPTNRELQVDFTTVARDVFVVAAERELEAKMPPAFEGKPLSEMYLHVWQKNRLDSGSPQVIRWEHLWVEALDEANIAIELDNSETFRDLPKDVREYYLGLGRRIGVVVLGDATRFRQLISPGIIDANWEAITRTGPNCQVDTFRARPSKQSLIAAGYFVGQVMDYVRSDMFLEAPEVRDENYWRGYSKQNPEFDMKHQFDFNLSPELPLNGYEPKEFLEDYMREMRKYYDGSRRRVKRLEGYGNKSEAAIQYEQEQAARYGKALLRAQKLLEG
jgi:hypothetical protein